MAKTFSMEFELSAKLANTYNAVFGGANHQLAELKTKLSSLAQTNATIAKFKGLQEQTHSLSSQFSQSQQKVKELANAIKDTSTPSKKLTNDFERANIATSTLKDKLTAKRLELGQVRTALEIAGISTTNLAEKERVLSAQTDKLKFKEEQFSSALAKRAQLQQSTANWRGKIFSTIALGSIAIAPMLLAAKAQEAAAEFKTSMMDATGRVSPDFAKLNALASQFGRTLPESTAEYRTMFLELRKGGIESESILNGVGKATAYLATVTHISTEDAAKYSSSLIKATGASNKEALNLIDTMQKLNDVKVIPAEAAEAFQKLSGVLKETQMQGAIGVKAYAPLIAMFTRQNMGGGEAGQAIARIINASLTIKHNTLAAIKSMYGLNFKFTNAEGSFIGVENFIKQLEQIKSLSTRGQADVIKNLFGGKPAVVAIVTELTNGLNTYKEIKEEMNNQANIEQKMGVHLDLLTVKLKNWGATMKAITVAIGEPLAALATPFVDMAVTGLQNTVLPFIKNHQKIIGVIAGVSASLIGIVVALNLVVFSSFAVRTAISGLQILFISFTKVITVLETVISFLAANPMVLVVGAIVLAVAALGYFAYKAGLATRVWQSLKNAISNMTWLHTLSSIFRDFINSISNGIKYIVDMISSIPQTFARLKNIFNPQANLNVNANQINTPFKLARNELTTAKAGATNISYNPVINITGGTPDILTKSLKDSHQDLIKLMTNGFANERRLAFS